MDFKSKEFDYKNYQKKSSKLPQIAATLQQLLTNVPPNLIELLNAYNCNMCRKSIPTLKDAVSHYNTEKHQNHLKIAGVNFGLFELPFTPSQILDLETGFLICADGSNKIHLVDPISKAKTEAIKVPDGVDKIDLEYCALCNLPFLSAVMAIQHYGGKKHKQRYFAKLTATTDNIVAGDFLCLLCNVVAPSEKILQQHLNGNSHQKKMTKCIDENNNRSVPPESSSKWGVIDYDAETDDSYQPFGIPAPLFDCKLMHHTPHIRLNGPYTLKQQMKIEPRIICTESRIGIDRFVDYDKDALRNYLETVYK